MEAGCHVLIEKPMASNIGEANAMVDCSRKNQVKLCVVHQNLCNPIVMRAKELVESGAVGRLLNVSVGTFERRDAGMVMAEDHWCHKLHGGIFYEILPHPIYLLQAFVRRLEPDCVLSAKLGDVPWMPVDEVRVLLRGDSVGLIVASCNPPVHGDTLDILGTDMALRGDLWGRTLLMQKARTKSPFEVGIGNLQLSSQLFRIIGGTAKSAWQMAGGKVSAHYIFISKFIESILHEAPPPNTPEDARETLRLLESICDRIEKQSQQ
jgi:predicted dehydrogenase